MNDTQFEFSYAPGTTQEQILGFEMAGEIWSQYLTDNVTINIHVEMTNQLPENVIGGALPGMKKDVEYKKVREKMLGDISSRDDWTAFYHGAWSDEFTVVVDGQEIDKVKKLKLTNANSKALDLIDGDQDKLDGYIVMSDLTGQ
ncbi:MAG: NF038122 family metalloprotease, partial [Cyanobacteria bacterium P01_A01_bin.83]